MAGPLAAAGAVQEPSEYATLSMDRAITGMWTQRSPLRDADVPYLYAKFYQAGRFDSLIDGINREVTSRLSNARRPGSSVWNPNTFPAINSYYPFKYIQNGSEQLRVIVDGRDGVIYDATSAGKTALFTKSVGAGKARFLGIGNILYFADGVDRKKLIRSPTVWTPLSNSFAAEGAYVVDSNLNLQLSIGAQTATITNIQITSNICTLFFSGSTPLNIPVGTILTLSGLTTVPALNASFTITQVENSIQVSFNVTHANVAFSVETGSATTGAGVTGAGPNPTWATGVGAITQDASLQWECRGSSIQDWMPAPALAAPIVTQVAAPTIYPAWAANTWYASLFVILDGNGNLQQLTTAGTTGGGTPTWATTPGVTTTDGSAVWTCKGPSTRVNSTSYAVGAVIQATYTYYITVIGTQQVWTGNGYITVPLYTQQAVTVTSLFQCTTPGTSGSSTPSFNNGIGTTTNDGTVVWTNKGKAPAWPGATQILSLATQVIDSNSNLETVQGLGKSGGSAPTWATTLGASTTDNTISWLNAGPYAKANTGAWIWAYSGQNSITNDVTTASPQSGPLVIAAGNQPVIQGAGFSDPQIDTIIVWRTAQGGSTLLEAGTIPNPGAGQNWIFTDTTPDTGLIPQSEAPVGSTNNPPAAAFQAPVYHQGCVFGILGNTVVWSNGPNTITGSGLTGFPPSNRAALSEQPIRLFSGVTNQGPTLFIFGTTNVYAIFGLGTSASPFTAPQIYLGGVGILSYDCVDLVGSTYYAFTGKNKFVSLDPSAGYAEVGFPIGDQLQNVTTGGISSALYNATSAYVTWHEQSSGDTAIYLSDGAVGWFRFSPVASPESGYLWSPRAAIVGGTSAVQSVETSPGQFQLLIGPASSGPILFRDTTTNQDNGVPFPSYDVKGNIVLCESGEVAEIAHIGLKSVAVGAKPIVSLLLGEISATTTTPFDQLQQTSSDPPDLPPSTTLYSDRYSALQNGVCPKCDNFQLKIDYGTQNFPDEMLKFSIYGAKHSERRQQ